MPKSSTATKQIFLDEFANTIAPDEHVAMVLDQTGWHGAKTLRVPDSITLVPLPRSEVSRASHRLPLLARLRRSTGRVEHVGSARVHETSILSAIKAIVDLDSALPNATLDLSVAKQQLSGSKISAAHPGL